MMKVMIEQQQRQQQQMQAMQMIMLQQQQQQTQALIALLDKHSWYRLGCSRKDPYPTPRSKFTIPPSLDILYKFKTFFRQLPPPPEQQKSCLERPFL